MSFAKQRHEKEFVPTTPKELKEISRRAAQREAERVEQRKVKESKPRHKRLSGAALREALLERTEFHVYRSNLFDKFLEIVKDLEMPKPRYKSYLPEEQADGEFMFDIASVLARMSWMQLNDLVRAAVTTDERPIGLATRDYSEALHFATHCIYLALGVVEKKGMLRLTDRSVLDDWPVVDRKRPSKEDKMSELEMQRRNAAMKASAVDDEEEDEPEEDEDEAEEEEEDEKPARGKFGKGAGKKKVSKATKPAKASAKTTKSSTKPAEGTLVLKDATLIKKAKPREGGGPKGKFYNLVPKKGIALKALLSEAKEAGIDAARAKTWIPMMIKNGYLSVG